ncbi:MAG: hypothetical protein AVDCRST_MAG53-1708, partial [uncultured Solirubrobacteraceae bacterium]
STRRTRSGADVSGSTGSIAHSLLPSVQKR